MNLIEFIQGDLRNAWIEEEGIKVYVRKSRRHLGIMGERRVCGNVFDVATLEASNPGHGAFTKFMRKLEEEWDGPILVESVLVVRLTDKLLRMGFAPMPTPNSCCVELMGHSDNFIKHAEKGK